MTHGNNRLLGGIRSTSRTNQPAWEIGGLGGFLGSSGNRGTDRSIQINANGQGVNNRAIFVRNQLGGVGRMRSMFASNADGVNPSTQLDNAYRFKMQKKPFNVKLPIIPSP